MGRGATNTLRTPNRLTPVELFGVRRLAAAFEVAAPGTMPPRDSPAKSGKTIRVLDERIVRATLLGVSGGTNDEKGQPTLNRHDLFFFGGA